MIPRDRRRRSLLLLDRRPRRKTGEAGSRRLAAGLLEVRGVTINSRTTPNAAVELGSPWRRLGMLFRMSVFGDDACSSRLSYRDGVLSLDRPPVAVHDVQPRGDVGAGRSAGLGGDAGGKPKGVTKGLWRVSRELRGSTAKGSRRRRQGGLMERRGETVLLGKAKKGNPRGTGVVSPNCCSPGWSWLVVIGQFRGNSGRRRRQGTRQASKSSVNFVRRCVFSPGSHRTNKIGRPASAVDEGSAGGAGGGPG